MNDKVKYDRGEGPVHEVHERKRSVVVPALIAGAVAAVIAIPFLTRHHDTVVTNEPAAAPVYAQRDTESQGTFGARDQADDRTGVYYSSDILAACHIDQPNAFFATNSAQLGNDDRATLSGLVDCLKTGPLAGRSVEVVGQTDMRGSSEYNKDLGQQRADSVAGYMREQGVASDHIRPTSIGKDAAQATDRQGMAGERRVDVRLVP